MPTKLVNGERVELSASEVKEAKKERQARLARQHEKWRETVTLSRKAFCVACFRAGLLSPEDSVVAAKGGWPPSFDAALASLPKDKRVEAQIEWAAVTEVRRNAPLLDMVKLHKGVSDEQLDALFGWTG